MQKSILTILTVLIISTCIQCKVMNSNDVKCRDINPFIQHKTNVRLFDTPSFVASHVGGNRCSYEWSKHGTCCEYRSLVDGFEKEMIEMNERIKKTTILAPSIVDNLSQMGVLAKKMKTSVNNENELREFINSTDLLLENLIQVQSEPSFGKSHRRCFVKVQELRGKSQCSTCSGRSNRFFSRDKKAYISQEVCSSFIDDCSESFENLMIYLDHLKLIVEEFGRVRFEKAIKGIMIEALVRLNQDLNNLLKNDVHLLIDEYINKKYTDMNDIQSKLCFRLLSLNNEPFLIKVIRDFERIDEGLRLATREWSRFIGSQNKLNQFKILPSSSHSTLKDNRNWEINGSGRWLSQVDQQDTPIFGGDTRVFNGGVTGITDTSISITYRPHDSQPMNIKVNIPFP